MVNKLRDFLEANFGDTSEHFIEQFKSGLSNSSGTQKAISKITATIFQVALHHCGQQSPGLNWAKTLIQTIQTTALQPAPKVREALFFPDGQSQARLIHWLGQAKHQLLVCVFTITNNDLRNALKDAHRRGIKIRIISDDECMKQQGSDVQDLRDFGIPTQTDDNPDAHMHNKFVVIDREILITGSFNWTVAAVHSNQENLVVIHDSFICQEYLEYFNDLWSEFRPVEESEHRSRGRYKNRRRPR